MDLIRSLLLEVEASDNDAIDPEKYATEKNIPKEAVTYHLALLVEAGLLEGIDVTTRASRGRNEYIIRGITWDGHEFIAAARSETLWAKTKHKVGETVGDVAMAVFRRLLDRAAEQAMGWGVGT